MLAGMLLVAAVSAQETKVVKDLRLWTGVRIRKTFADNWTLSLQEEIRLKENMSQINYFFTEVGLRYRINKNFALQGDIRFTQDKKGDNSYKALTRYNFDLRYKGRLKYMSIHYRIRYQNEVEGWNVFDQDTDYERQFRNRISLRVNALKHIVPYASAEIFQTFSPYEYPHFDYYRIILGMRFEPGNFGEFNLGWGFNRELTSDYPAMVFLFKLNYTYDF